MFSGILYVYFKVPDGSASLFLNLKALLLLLLSLIQVMNPTEAAEIRLGPYLFKLQLCNVGINIFTLE